MNLQVQCHDRLGAVAPGSWDALLARAERPTIYQSRAWMESWLGHFGERARPRLIAVYAGPERLVGLAALALVEQRLGRWWRRTVLTFLSSLSPAHAQSLGPLIDPQHRDAVCALLARAMLGLGGCDAIYFEHFVPDDPVTRLIDAVETEAGRRCRRWSGEPTWWLPLPDNEEAYRHALAPNLRKKLARLHNRARESGVRIEKIEDLADLDAALAAFGELSVERFERKGERSTMGDPRMLAFAGDLTHRCLMEQRAIVLTLRANDTIAGVLLGYQCGAWVGYYNAAFAPQYEALSPGTLLLDGLAREAIARGATTLDLLAGSGDYKQHWARDHHQPLQYAVLPRRPLRSLPFSVWEKKKSKSRS